MITHSGSEEKNCFKYSNEDFIKKKTMKTVKMMPEKWQRRRQKEDKNTEDDYENK